MSPVMLVVRAQVSDTHGTERLVDDFCKNEIFVIAISTGTNMPITRTRKGKMRAFTTKPSPELEALTNFTYKK